MVNKPKNIFLSLQWVGPATCQDFELLDIQTLDALARCDPDDLYTRIQMITKQKHDPCVWDVFACAIDQARGLPAKPWWEYSKIRKSKASFK